MANPRLAVATMTLDLKGNSAIMIDSLETLSKLGYDIFVADGGSSPKFVADMKAMGLHVDTVEGGLTFQHKHAILRAADAAERVLYVEPDKGVFFETCLEKAVDGYFREREEGFSAVSRTPRQMLTFPYHQREWEGKMNMLVGRETGVRGDFVYGPRFFPSSLALHLGEIQRDIGWAALMFLVGRAYNQRLPIRTIYAASTCPFGQRREDNEDHRAKQFYWNKKGFYLGLGKPEPRS
jgi:hypothetical protein